MRSAGHTSDEEKRQQSQSKMISELKGAGLIKEKYQPAGNPVGRNVGIVLSGKHKDNRDKTIYVKQVVSDKEHGIANTLAMLAAKKFGVFVPSVKFKQSEAALYLFSRDVADLKSESGKILNNKYYSLRVLNKAKVNLELAEDKKSCQINCTIDNINYSVKVEKEDLIRFVFSILILDLKDLHDDNIGMVFNLENGQGKFAIIDCELKAEPDSKIRTDFIIENIIDYLSACGLPKQSLIHKILAALVTRIDLECEVIIMKASKMDFNSCLREMRDNYKIEQWVEVNELDKIEKNWQQRWNSLA